MEDATPEFFSLQQAARYGHVTRQAVYLAIKRHGLKATKYGYRWHIKKSDYDEWREQKYNGDKLKFEGQYVFDPSKGHFSVLHVSKVISASLNIRFPAQKIYYLIRIGKIKSFKKGRYWVISREDAVALLEEYSSHKQKIKEIS